MDSMCRQNRVQKLKLWLYPQTRDEERREPSMGSGCNSISDPKAKKPLLASRLNKAKLENEELRLTAMQKVEQWKAIIKAILEWKKRIGSPEIDKMFLLPTNKEHLQQLCLTRSHPSEMKKTFITSVPTMFIGTSLQLKYGIQRWCSGEVFELRQYQKETERTWKNGGEIVVGLSVERQKGSKILLYSLYSLGTRTRTLSFH